MGKLKRGGGVEGKGKGTVGYQLGFEGLRAFKGRTERLVLKGCMCFC